MTTTVRVRLAGAGALAMLVLTPGCRSGPSTAPAPTADVRAYGVALRVDPATRHVQGHVQIAVRGGGAPAVELMLDPAMTVRRVEVDGQPGETARRRETLRVGLHASHEECLVEITYAGIPSTGLYEGRAAGQRVLFTDAWPQRGAGWLPAVHHPADPASFALAVDIPAPWEVVASGTAGAVTATGDGHRRWRFTLDAGAPSYTFAFAAADFAVANDTTGEVPVRHYLLRADSAAVSALARVPAALDTLATLLGPYPYGSFATVEVPLGFDGMENAAAPFLRAALYRRADGQLEEVAFHEAVHQWVGNRIVPADWRDLWLAEGAATYLTTVVYERLDGVDAARARRAAMSRLSADDARRPLRPGIVGEPFDVLNATVYGKGGAVFHMLRLKVGDAAFFGALRTLAGRARPTSTVDFRRALESAGAPDLGAFFAYWVYGGRVPTLRTHWDARTRVLQWRVERSSGMLEGLPLELRLRQGAAERYVPLSAGRATLRGSSPPGVEPVGVVMRVEG